jgi:hypothetical protein
LIYFFLFFAHYTDRYGHIREFQFTKFLCSPSAKTCGILPNISVSIYRILFVFFEGEGGPSSLPIHVDICIIVYSESKYRERRPVCALI